MRGRELVGREIYNSQKPQPNTPPPPPVQGPASLTVLPVYRTNSRRAVYASTMCFNWVFNFLPVFTFLKVGST